MPLAIWVDVAGRNMQPDFEPILERQILSGWGYKRTRGATEKTLGYLDSRSPAYNALFRATHTLKGMAGMLGFTVFSKAAHRMEDIFDLMRKGRLRSTDSLIEVLESGMLALESGLAGLRRGRPEPEDYLQPVRRQLGELEALARPAQGAAQGAAGDEAIDVIPMQHASAAAGRPAGRRHRSRRGRAGPFRDCDRAGAGVAAGLPDTYYDRRPAQRHRRGRHGQAYAAQRGG